MRTHSSRRMRKTWSFWPSGALPAGHCGQARVESARAQLETANALYQQTAQQRSAGLLAQIDVNKSQVQALLQEQRLASLQNDLAKQKINLARLTGLPPNDRFELSDDIPSPTLLRLTKKMP